MEVDRVERVQKTDLEAMIRQIILEKLESYSSTKDQKTITKAGILSVCVPKVLVSETDRMDTGRDHDIVYTRDLFTLEESKRLGCGIMEMKTTTFPWTLNYDEIDYVIKGTLSIKMGNEIVTAKEGELLLIPKGSSIEFSVPDYARFLYITYPADWANQA